MEASFPADISINEADCDIWLDLKKIQDYTEKKKCSYRAGLSCPFFPREFIKEKNGN